MAFAEYPVVSSSGSGGITKVADSIERNALTPADGDIVIQLDNDFLYEWNGSSWAVLADRTWQTAGSILGAKTFDTASRWSVATNQLVLGVTNTTTINSVAPSASRIYTIPDAGADASFVLTAGTQSVGGSKTFTSAVTVSASSNQVILHSGVNQLTLNSGTSAAARTYTVPDTGTTDTFAMLGGTQSFTGAKTFSSTITATNSSAPLTLNVGSSSNAELLFTSSATQPDLYINFRSTGTGPQSWLLGLNPSGISSNAFGLWDNTAGAPIFTTEQTTNVTTYYANVTINNASNQLSLSSSVNLLNLNSGTSAAARTYTFPDVGTTGTFAMLGGSQTFSALKTFSSGLAISGGSAANNTIWVASNTLNIRGGTSGTDIYNTAGNVIFDAADTGAISLGLSNNTAPFTTLNQGVVSKARSANETGSYSARQFLQLSAGSTWSADSHIATRTQTGYHIVEVSQDGSGSIYNNTVDAQTSGSALVTTNQKTIGSWTGAGAWTLGPSSGGPSVSHIMRVSSTTAGERGLKVQNTNLNTGTGAAEISLWSEEVDGSATPVERARLEGSLDANDTGGKLAFLTRLSGTVSEKGSVDRNGAWTWGAASGSSRHTIRASASTVLAIDNTTVSATASQIDFNKNGVTKFTIGTDNSSYGTDGFFFYNGSALVGGTTQAGAWTLGPSSNAGNLTHTVRIGNNGTVPCVTIQNTAADSVGLRFTGTSNSMDIAGSGGQLYCNGVYGKTSTAGITVLVNASHNWGTTISIREAKTNIQPLGSTLGWLNQLKTYTYQFRKQVDGQYTDEAEEFVTTGLMYDEVVQVNPGLCFELADGTPSGVEYTRLITPMLKAIQELHAELQTTKSELNTLR